MNNEPTMPVSFAKKIALRAIIDGAKAERERTISAILQIRKMSYESDQKAVILAMDTLADIINAVKLDEMLNED